MLKCDLITILNGKQVIISSQKYLAYINLRLSRSIQLGLNSEAYGKNLPKIWEKLPHRNCRWYESSASSYGFLFNITFYYLSVKRLQRLRETVAFLKCFFCSHRILPVIFMWFASDRHMLNVHCLSSLYSLLKKWIHIPPSRSWIFLNNACIPFFWEYITF